MRRKEALILYKNLTLVMNINHRVQILYSENFWSKFNEQLNVKL